MRVSIVLPAYNEAKRLRKAVQEVAKAADKIGYDYEIIIAEDGSTDGTDKIAAELAKEKENVVHLHSDERLGRGKALMNAFSKASGDIVVYMDVDLATDLKHLKELVDAIAKEGYDVATGSRLMEASKAERPLKRDIASKVYNFLVRLFLGSKIKDHQCGFKAFRKQAILEIGKHVKDNHWFWDTEVLVLAQKMGYKVKEIPVEWRHGGETKVEFGKDVVYMFSQIMRMWLEEKRKSKRYLVATTILAIAILLAIAYKAGFGSIYREITRLRPDLIAFAALLYATSYIARGYRFEFILSKLDFKAGVAFSTAAVSISQTVNVLTPIRIGDIARAYVFRRKDVPYSSSLGAIAAERFFDLISVAVIAAVAAAMLGAGLDEPTYALALAAILLLAILALSRMENFIGRIFRSARSVMGIKESVVLVILSLLIWATDIAVCYIISLSFSQPPLTLTALAVAVANIVKTVPITPGGVGTYEAAMTAILSSFYSIQEAFTISLVDHAIKNLTTILLGAVALAALNMSLREVER